ncbi:MAG: 4-hydroxy-tetrahydrodipicolinate synthase [Lachnospiraceae bacterium]|nr:4-hydroxy-tetrahydrodipicolinate synthase [Lachnospiraceae bacterium]MDY5521534.1 4-hydroxy-tetrahydrodipicolinate synthase [Agathobacter sp.]
MTLFSGAGVALITPFHQDKSVNYEMLGRLIDRQIESGTDALIVCGTTGEPATMSEEERLSVIRYAVERTGGRIPVIAGTGGNSTERAAEFSKKAKALGVDGLLVVTPYYNKATQNGLIEHYRMIASAVDLPIIMYNVPSRTGCNLLPETVLRIAEECPNVVGIKEASGNISQVAKLAALCGNRLAIYSGNDDQIVPILSLGGKGVISVLSNVVPDVVHQIVDSYLNGDIVTAQKLQLQYLSLANALFTEVNPIPVKAAMQMIGYDAGGLRLPLTELEEAHRAPLMRELREAGLTVVGD